MSRVQTSINSFTTGGDAPLAGRTDSSASASPPHFRFVDSLRGIAILMVITFHCCVECKNVHPWVQAVALQGKLGVQLFFVVSAFTLFSSLQSRGAVERKPLHTFFTRRFFRIAPLFYLAAAFYGLEHWASRATSGPRSFGPFQFIATLLFVHGWFPSSINTVVPGGWSISAEFMFYLCLPLLFRGVRSVKAALWLTLISTVFVASGSPFAVDMLSRPSSPSWNVHIADYVYWTFPSQFPIFCLGIVLYFVLRRGNSEAAVAEQSPAIPNSNISTGILCVSLAAFLLLGSVPLHVLYSVAFVPLAYGLAVAPLRLIVNRPTQFIGKISFSGYVWHFYLLDKVLHPGLGIRSLQSLAMGNGTLHFALVLIAVTTLTLGASTITYLLIELPGQRLGRRLIDWMRWGKIHGELHRTH